jgi:hypothetical protein
VSARSDPIPFCGKACFFYSEAIGADRFNSLF